MTREYHGLKKRVRSRWKRFKFNLNPYIRIGKGVTIDRNVTINASEYGGNVLIHSGVTLRGGG